MNLILNHIPLPIHSVGLHLEAESFSTKGSWVVDQQFMEQVASSYLMVYGMGKPVSDAETGGSINYISMKMQQF